MAKIKAVYYNGVSSKGNSVELDLSERAIKIYKMPKEDEVDFGSYWYVDKLEDIDFSSSDTVHLKYGAFPYQTLVIDDIEDALFFRKVYPELGNKNIYRKVLSANLYKMIGISLTALILVGASYIFVVAPFVAEKAAGLIPQKAEIKLGEKMTEHLFAAMNFDDEKSEVLSEFYETIGLESTYPVKLYLEESSTVNAFAVPGGQIVVFQGIIDAMDTWEELAGLLGHELAHVEQQHSLKGMCRNLSTYFVFSVITGDVSGVSAVLLEKCLMLKDLANSRSAEKEADEVGFQYLLDLDINPKGMVDLFEGMQASEIQLEDIIEQVSDTASIESPGQVNEIEEEAKSSGSVIKKGTRNLAKMLSTHPATDERITYLSEALEEYSDRSFPENLLAQELFKKLKGEE